MTNFEYAGTSFRTFGAMTLAAVEDWMTAGGLNSDAVVAEMLAASTDEALADELIASGWTIQGADRSDIIGAIADFRATR